MLNDFVEKVQGIVIKPVETFRKSREDTPKNALAYYSILLIINAILSTLVPLAGISTMSINESFLGMRKTPWRSFLLAQLCEGSSPYLLRIYGSLYLSGFLAGEKIISRF
jgi:hypothetical protein